MSYGWLWAGLYFILVSIVIVVILISIIVIIAINIIYHCHVYQHHRDQVIIVGVTSLFGYIEVITSTLVSIKPSYAR